MNNLVITLGILVLLWCSCRPADPVEELNQEVYFTIHEKGGFVPLNRTWALSNEGYLYELDLTDPFNGWTQEGDTLWWLDSDLHFDMGLPHILQDSIDTQTLGEWVALIPATTQVITHEDISFCCDRVSIHYLAWQYEEKGNRYRGSLIGTVIQPGYVYQEPGLSEGQKLLGYLRQLHED